MRFVALLVAAATLVLPGVASGITAPGGKALTLEPSGAPAGSTISVAGSGFAGDCDVLLYWGSSAGDVLGRAEIAADGTFSTHIAVPAYVRAGSNSIHAVGRGFGGPGSTGCGADSGSVATSPFTITGAPPSMFDGSVPLLSRVLRGRGVDTATLERGKSSTSGIHAIVQLHTLPTATDLASLRSAGVTPLAYLNSPKGPGTAYIASIEPTVTPGSPAFTRLVRAVQPLVAQDKIDAGLAFATASGGPATTEALILFFGDVTAAEAQLLLARHGIVGVADGASSTYRATLTHGDVQRLAQEDAVQFLAAVPEPGQYDLDVSRDNVNADELQQFDVPSATYLGLSGLGIQLSIHDSGVDEHHNDFNGRMLNTLHPGDGGDHGTHVAGIAAGSGAMSDQLNADGVNNMGTAFQWRGMAPQAEIAAYGSQTADSVVTMTDAIVNNGVDVSNHSYSYNDGQYDATMASIDTIIRGDAGIPARPVIFSAGNQGGAPQYGQNSGYFSLSKSCKNCIMVANLNDDGSLGGGSSHGPTPDGRVKPEIGANGDGVISTGADVDNDGDAGVNNADTEDSYRNKSGTSMSTPAVTGVVALLLQQWAEQFGVDIDTAPPLPSTVKAILVQTATDVTGNASGMNPDTGAATVTTAGPDYGSGYGQVDALAASQAIKQRMFIEDSVAPTDVTDMHLASVVPGQDELRVTLAWDDLPGTPNANHAAPTLVNDLDLLLVGPNGEVVRPLVLPAVQQFDCDGDSTNGTQTGNCPMPAGPGADPGPWGGVAAQGTDRLNNLEQVVVANPAPGTWRARVSVLNTDSTVRLPLGGEQQYSLAGVTADRADLSVNKTDSPDPATAGEQLFYTINIHNDGPETASNVVAVDTLPEGVTYVTTDLPGGCVESPEGTLTCTVGDIPADETRSFRIKVAIDPDLVSENNGPVTIFNTVTVSSNTPDEDPSDNTDTEGTIVDDLADLDVHKMCKPDGPLPAGETGHCTIFVDNYGPSYARDVTVTDVLLSDGSFTISNVTPSQGTCSATSNVSGGKKFTCNLGDLSNMSPSTSGRATIFYEVTANEAMDVNDIATATSSTPDPDDTNNRAEESLHITAVSDLALTKAGPATAVAGETIAYTLQVT
ncbi:MAG TPA: S8 family serine peptidase, partial [Acidimicrobiales bacterium]